MIEYLKGQIVNKDTTSVVISVQGVGYGIKAPLNTLLELPKLGETVELWIHTRVREDAITLYGFARKEERNAFCVLLGASGVGPKVALAILSTLSLQDLVQALGEKDSYTLSQVPGVGKKTAEKLFFELEGKLGSEYLGQNVSQSLKKSGMLSFPQGLSAEMVKDAISALENLGFKDKDIRPVLKEIETQAPLMDFAEFIKKALVLLTKPRKNERLDPSKNRDSSLF